jgi:ribonuclease HI
MNEQSELPILINRPSLKETASRSFHFITGASKLSPAKTKLTIASDGGCSPNPGRKYGSYSITLNGQMIARELKFNLGYGTNNEAEYEALEMALKRTAKELELRHIQPSECYAYVRTDSTIVRNGLMRKHRERKINDQWKLGRHRAMMALAKRCLALLEPFQFFSVDWESRTHNVMRFGH